MSKDDGLDVVYDQTTKQFLYDNQVFSDLEELQDYRIQKKKDYLALQNNRKSTGGGVVGLTEPKRTEKWVYDDVQSGISDLYHKASNGDSEAERLIDDLWKISIDELRQVERTGIEPTTGCLRCGYSYPSNRIPEKCPKCGMNNNIMKR